MLSSTLVIAVDAVVTLTLHVVNDSAASVELRFPSSQQYDFSIRSRHGDSPEWRWSDDRMFAAAETGRVLAPGERWTITESWRPGAPGTYVVTGLLCDPSHLAQSSQAVTIR